MILEVACFSAEDALMAAKVGADRIEFCTNYQEGGLYPGAGALSDVIKSVNIPVAIMIRPRSGDFCYTETELDVMRAQMMECLPMKPAAFVFGALSPAKEIHLEACRKLLQVAGSIPSVFHRAIDQCRDIERSLEELMNLGFTRVLTSGGKTTAEEGLEMLKTLKRKFGQKIEIMPGGGIRSGNAKVFSEFSSIHSACRVNNKMDIQEIKTISDQR